MAEYPKALDEMASVRRRMRHLARLNIEPTPMHPRVKTPPAKAPVALRKEQLDHLAWRVIAVQMGHAVPISALD